MSDGGDKEKMKIQTKPIRVCIERPLKSAENKGGRPMVAPTSNIEVKSIFKPLLLTPPFRFAQHLPCRGGKKKSAKISRLPFRGAVSAAD